ALKKSFQSSRQSFGDSLEWTETPRRISRSPSHDDLMPGEEPVSRSTRSHGRAGGSTSTQSERQMRERKQPVLYSPVAKSSTVSQPRTVKRKS
ncbi:periplasmic protein CpxP domain protein, partial [Necator americanus]